MTGTAAPRAGEAGWVALTAAALAAVFAVLAWPSTADAQRRPLRPKCETPLRTLNVSSQGGIATFTAREPLLGCVTPSSGTSFRVRQTCTFHCQHWHTWVPTGTPKPANIQLKATPTDGTHVVGWSGNCTPRLGQDRSDCTVRVASNPTAVVATLSPTQDTTPPTPFAAGNPTPSSYSAVIRWFASSGHAGYDVFRNETLVARLARGATRATVRNLTCRTSYTFRVEAFDTAGNEVSTGPIPVRTGRCGPTTPPNTILHVGPGKRTKSRSAYFHWGSNRPRVAYQCKLDRSRWRACRPGKRYRSLRKGVHTFQVRARDRGGTDRTPARYRWRIV